MMMMILHDKREVMQMEILPRVRSRSKGGERGGANFLHVSMLEIPFKPSLVDRPDNTQPYKRQKLAQKDKRKWKLFSFPFPSLPFTSLALSPFQNFINLCQTLSVSKKARPHGEMNLHLHWCITTLSPSFFATQNHITTQRVFFFKRKQQLSPHH